MPSETLQAGIALLGVVSLLLAMVVLLASLRVARWTGPHSPAHAADRTVDDPAVDRAFAIQQQQLDAITAELTALVGRVGNLETGSRHAVQHVGLVRYNPFDDTGGNQSFALAMLDADANGIVLSSLHSRQATRIYLKGIQAGRAEGSLSAEETAALRQAGLAI